MSLEDRLEKITSRTVPLYAMIALLVLFANPSGLSCFFGFLVVIAGEALRFWATGHLRKNEELTTSGPYGYLQSPLYLGTFIIATGMSIMARNPVIWIITAVIFFVSYVPRKQEREWGRLDKMFGEEFHKYKSEVKYFFPRFTPYPGGSKHLWSFAMTIENTEHQTAMVVVLISFIIFIRVLF